MYRKNIRSLEKFHQQKLRSILGIIWEDRVSNNAVLTRAGLSSLEALMARNQLRFLGHLYRRDDSIIPKQTLFGELERGSRSRGRPMKRWKDQIKQTLTKTNIPTNTWESLAADRSSWRRAVIDGVTYVEDDRIIAAEQKRRKRLVLFAYKPTPIEYFTPGSVNGFLGNRSS